MLVGLGPGEGVGEGIGVGVSTVGEGKMSAGGLVAVADGTDGVGVGVCAGISQAESNRIRTLLMHSSQNLRFDNPFCWGE